MLKDSVKRTGEPGEGKYRPGKITFQAKKEKSVKLGKIQELMAATRLSGHTNMRVEWWGLVTVVGGASLAPEPQQASSRRSATSRAHSKEGFASQVGFAFVWRPRLANPLDSNRKLREHG